MLMNCNGALSNLHHHEGVKYLLLEGPVQVPLPEVVHIYMPVVLNSPSSFTKEVMMHIFLAN